MVKDKQMSFEESLASLEAAAEKLKKEGTTLNESIANFQEGMKHYINCKNELDDARQMIRIFEKESGIFQEF
ncbi:MAG: exodeoxyribonuclease VII small subunit [Anaerovoracaceae bacterium]